MLLKLELKLEEVNVILSGLGELPAKLSIDVIEKVRSQVISQMKETKDTATPENLSK